MNNPRQLHHNCLLPDILIYMHFDEAVQDINATVELKDWLTVLVHSCVKLVDLTSDQLRDVKVVIRKFCMK